MEKPSRRRLKKRRWLLRFVHKAASFSVPNTPYSPARVHAHRAAFSGPVVPMIPAEARGRDEGDVGFEPTSPRVTCVGRVEFRKQDAGGGAKSRGKERRAPWLSVLGGMFRRRARHGAGGGGDAGEDGFGPPPATESAGTTPPSLGQMRRLGGGRATCRGMEYWRAPGGAKEKGEEQAEEPVEEEEEGEEQVAAGSTAVEVVAADGGVALEPRKEVNLWKRRAVAPIGSLQL